MKGKPFAVDPLGFAPVGLRTSVSLSRSTDTGNVDPFCYPAFSWTCYSSEGVFSLISLHKALLCKFQSLPERSIRCYHLHSSGM